METLMLQNIPEDNTLHGHLSENFNLNDFILVEQIGAIYLLPYPKIHRSM
jgi:hypothetical protein